MASPEVKNDLVQSEKAPEPSQEAVKDVQEGELTELDETELFLRQNGITHAQVQGLLEDQVRVKRLMRRVDRLLLPLLCGTFFLQFIDKQVSVTLDK